MPQLEFCAGSTDRCYSCNEDPDPENPLRKCNRCQVARYCSTACQQYDWKRHKQTCVDHKAILNSPAYQGPGEPSMEDELKLFMKWNDVWRTPLISWAAFAADLANQNPDYLLNHMFIVLLSKTTKKKPARSKYQIVTGGMRSANDVDRIVRSIADPDARASFVQHIQQREPQKDLLRITVICTKFFSSGYQRLGDFVPDGRDKMFTNPMSAESRLLSTALFNACMEKFSEHIRTGNVAGHIRVLDDAIQAVKYKSEQSFDVD